MAMLRYYNELRPREDHTAQLARKAWDDARVRGASTSVSTSRVNLLELASLLRSNSKESTLVAIYSLVPSIQSEDSSTGRAFRGSWVYSREQGVGMPRRSTSSGFSPEK